MICFTHLSVTAFRFSIFPPPPLSLSLEVINFMGSDDERLWSALKDVLRGNEKLEKLFSRKRSLQNRLKKEKKRNLEEERQEFPPDVNIPITESENKSA